MATFNTYTLHNLSLFFTVQDDVCFVSVDNLIFPFIHEFVNIVQHVENKFSFMFGKGQSDYIDIDKINITLSSLPSFSAVWNYVS